jgi:hypothetical protein
MLGNMREPSIWSAALMDIWAAKPRLHRPAIANLDWQELRRLVGHEGKLEKRLTSHFTSKLIRTISLPEGELLLQVEFVPDSSGRFLASWIGDLIKLFSSEGDVLHSLPGMCGEPKLSRFWSRPVISNTPHVIQVQMEEMYVLCKPRQTVSLS